MKGKGVGKVIKAPKFHGSMAMDEAVQLSTTIRRDTDAMLERLVELYGGNRRSVVERAIRDTYRQEGLDPITEEDVEKYSKRNPRQ